jgi:outer membrane protein assembly factor BamB
MSAQSNTPIFEFPAANGAVNALAESGGTLYLGGAFTTLFPSTGSFAVVDDAAGSTLPPFPFVNGNVNDVIPDGAGGWYIGGKFDSVGGLARNGAAHILADGRVAGWNPNVTGLAPSTAVFALAVSGHHVYLGGDFDKVGGVTRNRLARVDSSTGALDLTWNPNVNDIIDDFETTPEYLYIAGLFTSVGAMPRGRVAAFKLFDGTLDPTWNPNADGRVRAMKLDGAGRMYLGGEFANVNVGAPSVPRTRLAAVEAVGVGTGTGVAYTWAPTANAAVYSLGFDTTLGKLFVAGSFTNVNGTARNRLASVDAGAGVLDLSWNPNVTGAGTPIVYLIQVTGGLVYVAGAFDTVGATTRRGLAAVHATTGALQAWNPSIGAPAPADAALSLAVQGNTIGVAGSFKGIGAQSRTRLAAIDVASGALLPWSPTANSAVNALAINGTSVYAGGTFTAVNGTGRNRAAALDTAGALLSFNPNANGAVTSLTVGQAGNVFLGGQFTTVAATSRARLALVNGASGALVGWIPPAPNNSVNALALDGATLYVGGQFTQAGATLRGGLAAFDANTAVLDAAWNPNVTGLGGIVNALVPAAAGGPVYVGGVFSTVGGASRARLGSVAAAGGGSTGTVQPWNPSANSTVNALAVLATGEVAAGGAFTLVNSTTTRNRLAALRPVPFTNNANPWDPDLSGDANALALDAQRLFVGGNFLGVGTQTRPGLAAFCLATPPSALLATPNGNNRIDLSWTGSAPSYAIYRSLNAGGPYAFVANTATPLFSDTPIEGGVTYHYVVRASDGCLSENSNEASTSTSGACEASPQFEAVVSVAQPASNNCTADLRWPAGSAVCPATGLRYAIYRDINPTFLPSVSNRLATHISGTSYQDFSSLIPGQTYYYIVRASHDSNGHEDGNLVRLAFQPTGCTFSLPDNVPVLTVRAGNGESVLDWTRPVSGYFQTVVRVCGPSSSCLSAYPKNVLDGDPVAVVGGPPGVPASFTHGSLMNAQDYRYAAFVENASGSSSAPTLGAGRPDVTTGVQPRWAFGTAASSLTPVGILPARAYLTASNDRALHAMRSGAGGGMWPSGYRPYLMNAPAQGRPTLVSLTLGPALRVAFVGSQDGRVYALDADTGNELWRSAVLGAAVQAAPSIVATVFGGVANLVLVGTREPTGASHFVALNLNTGTTAWVFDNGAGADPSRAMGIISAQALVDGAAGRVYFASRRRGGGSQDTVWALNFNAGGATLAWRRALGDIDGALTAGGTRLYVGTNSGKVYALDKATGGDAWSPLAYFDTGTGQAVKGFVFPALVTSGVYRLLFSAGDNVFALTDNGGSAPVPLWNPLGAVLSGASTPLAVLPRVYFGSDDGKLYSFDGNSTFPAPVALPLGDTGVPKVVGRPTYDGVAQLILVGTDQGIVYAVPPFQ